MTNDTFNVNYIFDVNYIFEAVKNNNINYIKNYISTTNNIDIRDQYHNTPLHVAIKHGKSIIIYFFHKKTYNIHIFNQIYVIFNPKSNSI